MRSFALANLHAISKLAALGIFLFSIWNWTTLIIHKVGIASDSSISPVGSFIPNKIWQTWKVDVGKLQSSQSQKLSTWIDLNPEYRYELLTDSGADSFVYEFFGQSGLARDEEIFATWNALTSNILRADYLRYLLLWVHGGLYTDIDTSCTRSIHQWIPDAVTSRVNMVVGIEIDSRADPHQNDQWAHPYGFVQWTILSAAGHPVLDRAIALATMRLQAQSIAQNCSLAELTFNMDVLLKMTGPGVFTDSLLSYLTDIDIAEFDLKNAWNEFEHLQEGKLVKDVFILPINAFASGQAHSGSLASDSTDTYLIHSYQFSWESERY